MPTETDKWECQNGYHLNEGDDDVCSRCGEDLNPPMKTPAEAFDEWLEACPVDYQVTGNSPDEGRMTIFFTWGEGS